MNKVVVKNYLSHNTMATKTTDIAAAGAAAKEEMCHISSLPLSARIAH